MLLVLFRTEEAVWKSLRNLGERVQILLPEELNTYDVLLNDWLVFSKASLDATVARLSDGGADADERRRARRHREGSPRHHHQAGRVGEVATPRYDGNVYTFVVAPDANKIEIRNAVEELFATKVASVRTINRKGKRKRNRTSGVWSTRATSKRAIVTLAAGAEPIDIFGS